MPLTPREAVVLTEQNLQEVEEWCQAIDAWLRSNRTEVDHANRIPLAALRLPVPCRKVQWAVAEQYRKVGWLAWFETGPRPCFYLATSLNGNHQRHLEPPCDK